MNVSAEKLTTEADAIIIDLFEFTSARYSHVVRPACRISVLTINVKTILQGLIHSGHVQEHFECES